MPKHSLITEHSSSFQFLTTNNKAAVNILAWFCGDICFQFSSMSVKGVITELNGKCMFGF